MSLRSSVLFLETDHVVALEKLVDEDNVPVTTAIVELIELKDAAGADVTGLTLPIPMPHTSDGDYLGALPDSIVVSAGSIYKAKVRAVANGFTLTLVETLLARAGVA